jgi:hypothetical protein
VTETAAETKQAVKKSLLPDHKVAHAPGSPVFFSKNA